MGKTILYISPFKEGHKNLAIDEWLLDSMGEDDIILYFYINENAVIIGKNQNPWRECNLKKMREDGVELVRRVTGGGAVFHDEGNLNFSFVAGKELYDEHKQFELILNALRSLGIPCEFSGKNDLKAEGMKFSGNAFSARKNICQHHGTLLVNANLKKLSEYLNPDPKKMKAKGITSVSQKVCNLSDFKEGLTVDEVMTAVSRAFAEEYGEYAGFVLGEKELSQIDNYYKKQSSWEWMLGSTPEFDIQFDERFSWGSVQLHLNLEKGAVKEAKVFTDANDAALPDEIEKRITGIKFGGREISEALKSERRELAELSDYFLGQDI